MLTLITPPTTEPVTLTELKKQCRLDVADTEFIVAQSIAPGSYNVGTTTGTGVNIAGYEATFIIDAADVGGTVTVTFQHSLDGTNWTDIEDDGSTVDANSTAQYDYIGDRSYLRAVAVVATAAADFSVEIQLRALATTEDTELNGFITAARQEAERQQRRAIMQATYKLSLDRFPSGIIYSTIFPITAVNSIKYFDVAGDQQTLDPAIYTFDSSRIMLKPNQSFPSTYPLISAVEIELVAGYASADDVPTATKIGILMLAAHYYEHREAVAAGSMVPVPLGAEALLSVDAWHGG